MKPRINIKAGSPYRPLFERGGTRYKVILGGRGSAKSFTVSTALIDRTYDDDGTILFTRYTLVNAEVSILPEFVDKIERLNLQADFTKSGNDLINTRTGGRILFRGIKTSSGINTAALKSIPKLKMWVNDESEELVDETVFDTIDLSIRYNNVPAEVWLVANPPDIDHFLYRRFFKAYGIPDVWNGVKDDVTYIHTTYLTNPHLPPEYVALAEKSKTVDVSYYEHIWLGHFAAHKEGLIYKGWNKTTDEFWPTHLRCWYGVDWGVQDPTAIVRCTYDPDTGILWFKQLMYRGEYNISTIAGVIRGDILNRPRDKEMGGHLLHWENAQLTCDGEAITGDVGGQTFRESLKRHGIEGWQAAEVEEWVEGILRYDGEIYCDPARPENIKSLKIDNMLWAIEANNRDKVGRIQYMKYFDVYYIGDDIEGEVRAYRWKQAKNDKTRYIDEPQDGDDHLMDACNYACTSHLRKLGIANKLGEK
jgi:phage terminase large subunit